MRPSLLICRAVRLALVAVAFALTVCGAVATEQRKMEARLIWGTNDEKSPDPAHKPLDGELARKLGDGPLKWKNYFEVKKLVFDINSQTYTNIVMSKKCSLEMKDKGGNNVTVKIYNEGKEVRRVDKPLPKGDVIVIGGDDKGNNAWFITVRPVAPAKPDAKVTPSATAKPAPAK